jgi:hypothetical protein
LPSSGNLTLRENGQFRFNPDGKFWRQTSGELSQAAHAELRGYLFKNLGHQEVDADFPMDVFNKVNDLLGRRDESLWKPETPQATQETTSSN